MSTASANAHPDQRPVLVTGGAGLLGQALLRTAPPAAAVHATQRRIPVETVPAHTVELSDEEQVNTLVDALCPRLIFHTAYSMANGERDIWMATKNIVTACRAVGATLIYLSTDALFDGERAPYGEQAEPEPVHEYGQWKARAEAYVRREMPAAAVIRTSLITSFDPPDPRTAWVTASLRAGHAISLFVDELRCPITPTDLAGQLWEIAALPSAAARGVWHLVGPEAISRYALGLLIALHAGLDPDGITPAWSADSGLVRPRDLRLLTARADRTLNRRAHPISSLVLSR